MNKYPDSLFEHNKYLKRKLESLSEIIKLQDKRLNDTVIQMEKMAEYAERKTDESTVWFWHGDGYDNTKSMCNSTIVVFRADELRYLLKNGETVADELK